MKERLVQTYMDIAYKFSELSYAKRLQVGCIVVKDQKIISTGYNGTPSGADNCCEDETGHTKLNVSHAEENALMKLCASTESSDGAMIFITHSPCIWCSKLINNAKIKKVFYSEDYRSDEGIKYLREYGVEVVKMDKKEK